MNKVDILAIGRHPEILQTVLRLINNNPAWNATGAITDEEALAIFATLPFKMVLLCNGINDESEASLRATFTAHSPNIIIVQHYGGGSGLLAGEIYEALGA